ncbi:MAG: glycosyltransferase family 2 protein [Candidatus Scalindua sp. AMX11]|nr:MAG: glycosyltransferase family 2 protein [Candidatus Scalindua sp.]NOG82597.1 glycosyltransferase family 2 protein [Planctomycetota bacterium]RZV78327.1 MAG: glycosyltransferase family 2 protein [Candidatus Scalindua sp. SCAELEC01]TDE65124.1 MAG: glycosyltransferase family 2 protein [Candidatus Scalindua sp. AMX11]GJQ59527.1 MAG: glycosyl transferase [Candidatus Scalindua sp.]
MVDISFIIVNWNTRNILINCIDSIYQTVKGIDFEICVVDNNSNDGSQEAIRKHFPNVTLIENSSNTGFGYANNQALKIMKGRFSVHLNSDTILQEEAIKNLLNFMKGYSSTGLCGVQLLNEDGSKQNSIDNFPSLETELLNKSILRLLFPHTYPSKSKNINKPIEVDSVIGACIMVRKEAIDEVGIFDEDYFFFLEETDWCFRMKKSGWKVYHFPGAKVLHLAGHSKKKVPWQAQIEYYRSLYLFFKKNRGLGSYITLRILKPIKVFISLILNFLANLILLFQNERQRNKLVRYYKLFIWHLLFCPDTMGIRN